MHIDTARKQMLELSHGPTINLKTNARGTKEKLCIKSKKLPRRNRPQPVVKFETTTLLGFL